MAIFPVLGKLTHMHFCREISIYYIMMTNCIAVYSNVMSGYQWLAVDSLLLNNNPPYCH